MLSLIIDPSATGEYSAFSDEVEKYLAYIAETKPRSDTKEVLLPGQPEVRARIVRAQGFDVDAVTVDQLSAAALAAGIDEATTQALLGVTT
jgi:LDH2 family malate/lactate/ureidoglycolate dehydrogenase